MTITVFCTCAYLTYLVIYLVRLHQVKHLIQPEGSADWSPWKSPSSCCAISPDNSLMNSVMLLQRHLCPVDSIWLFHWRNGCANLCPIDALPTSRYDHAYDHLCWLQRTSPQELKNSLSWSWKLQCQLYFFALPETINLIYSTEWSNPNAVDD